MAIKSNVLSQLISSYQPDRVVGLIPGGNQGDQLIYLGMKRLMRCLNIPYEEYVFGHDSFPPTGNGDLLYVHGAGGFTPFWSGRTAEVLKHAFDHHSGVIVVGPSTFYDDRNYLEKALAPLFKMGDRRDVHVFSRENYSHDIVTRLGIDGVSLHLDHDTAFNCDPAEFSSELLDSIKTNSIIGRGKHTLYAIRSDPEMKQIGCINPLLNPIDPVKYCYSYQEWLRLHASAKKIVTNRLHSSIYGAIIGLPVTLLPNSYHKNRGVWEMSLQEYGVKWEDSWKPSLVGALAKYSGAGRLISSSRRFQRAYGRVVFGSDARCR